MRITTGPRAVNYYKNLSRQNLLGHHIVHYIRNGRDLKNFANLSDSPRQSWWLAALCWRDWQTAGDGRRPSLSSTPPGPSRSWTWSRGSTTRPFRWSSWGGRQWQRDCHLYCCYHAWRKTCCTWSTYPIRLVVIREIVKIFQKDILIKRHQNYSIW